MAWWNRHTKQNTPTHQTQQQLQHNPAQTQQPIDSADRQQEEGGLTYSQVAKGVKLGIVPNDIINDPYREYLAKNAGTTGLTGLIEAATDIMQKETEKCMDWMGSSGKASSVKLS